MMRTTVLPLIMAQATEAGGEVVTALVDEGIVRETTGTIGMMKTTRGVNSVGASRP